MPRPGVNETCETCKLYLATDPAEKFLQDKVLELYNFFVALQRRSFTAKMGYEYCRTSKGIETQLECSHGIPGVDSELPAMRKMY